jgi:Enolase C-terminal domain-like
LALPIPIRADESCRTLADLDRLDGKSQAINIKLDKAGGLTEALALAAEAKRRGLRIMVGGTIGTAIGIAPALLIAQQAEMVDLDGPLFLASDRFPGLRYEGGMIRPAEPNCWGGPADMGPSASESVDQSGAATASRVSRTIAPARAVIFANSRRALSVSERYVVVEGGVWRRG